MILDTNAYSALVRGNTQLAKLVRAEPKLTLPLPVIAELHAGFLGGNQPDRNQELLNQFLSQPLVSIFMPDMKTSKHYGELQQYARQQGRALGNNDIWIAALAQQFDETLVTFDQDFSVFADLFGDKLLLLA